MIAAPPVSLAARADALYVWPMQVRSALLRFVIVALALVALALPQAPAAARDAGAMADAASAMPHHMADMAGMTDMVHGTGHAEGQADLDLCVQHCLASVAILPATPAPAARTVGRRVLPVSPPGYPSLDPPEPQGPPPKATLS